MPNVPAAEARKIAQYLEDQATETNDGMANDPEDDTTPTTEDAFITVTIGGTDYQMPAYQA